MYDIFDEYMYTNIHSNDTKKVRCKIHIQYKQY